MIEAVGLTRRFGNTTALADVSFSVARGEVVGLLGPNGAGKTTAMRILTCTLPPSSGQASIDDHDVVDESLAVRRRIGFMPENVPLYPDATVAEHLRFTADLKDVPANGRAAHIEAIVERTGLEEVNGRMVGNLSKGYRQRVGLAQALIGDPEVLILDEPSSGLDPQQIVEIRDLIRGFQGERTVLLSSHILGEVSRICSRVIILDRGRLTAEVDAADLPDASTRPRDALEDIFLRLTGDDRGGDN